MKLVKVLFLCCFVFPAFGKVTYGQTVPPVSVIVDTDCGQDDLRALCMLTAIRQVDIKAIVTSDGALSPMEGLNKVTQLMHLIGRDKVPVAAGRISNLKAPVWREFCRDVSWGDNLADIVPEKKEAESLLDKTLSASPGPITIICLGPLTNIYDLLKLRPETQKNIKRIIWFNESYKPLSGTNYERDKEAANFILNSKVPVDMISNLTDTLTYSPSMQNALEEIPSPFARLISSSLKLSSARHHTHPILWDELTTVYLWYPELFDMQTDLLNPRHSYTKAINNKAVQDRILQLSAQKYIVEKNITFENFPDDPNLYQYDVREFMGEIIRKYGKEEWRLCILTNEIHGHLGVYSIIGAKMGLKAREIMNSEIDRVAVLTFAGKHPPYSCLNDGIQISTGATLGFGTISLSNDSVARPEAIFTYKDRKIKLKLKEQYVKQIDDDFNKAIVAYGNLTNGYWKAVRDQALRFWSEWDRNEIFDIQELKQ
jgi:inosine-uridine nucleoside N-ribohydrolase/formylmethanofuran dehydrogenase subunit E